MMQRLDLVDGGLLGDVDRLGFRTAEERLQRGQHLDVPHVVDGVVADRAGEHGHCVGREMRAHRGSSLVLDDVSTIASICSGV